jgi:hypothetical protein
LTLGTGVVLDAAEENVSTVPSVARRLATDSAVATWIEVIAGLPEVEVVVTADYVRPGAVALATAVTGDTVRAPDVAVATDTTILVVWSSNSPSAISAQRFDMALVPQGTVVVLSDSTANCTVPRVAASDARFMVVWQQEGTGIVAAAVGPDGTLVVPATTLAAGTARRPTIAPDLLGGFAVAYETDEGAEVLRMSPDAVPAGTPLHFAGGSRPEITGIPAGGLVVAYQSEGRVRLARLGCTP